MDPALLLDFFPDKAFRSAVARVPSNLWGLADLDLEKLGTPSKRDHILRVAVATELAIGIRLGQKSNIANVYRGRCTYTHFFNNVLGRPNKLVWVFRPLQNCEEALKFLLPEIIDAWRKLLEVPLYDKEGNVNNKVVELKFRAILALEKSTFFHRLAPT